MPRPALQAIPFLIKSASPLIPATSRPSRSAPQTFGLNIVRMSVSHLLGDFLGSFCCGEFSGAACSPHPLPSRPLASDNT